MKTVLITGASRGIGHAAALMFAREGYAVAACFHQNEHAAQSLLEELSALGCDAAIFRADIADRAQATQLIQAVLLRFGQIDVLVNNAGIAQQKQFCDLTAEDWTRMFDVNIGGMFHLCQLVLPQMVRRQKGRVINLSSIWGIAGASCEVHYSASKAAVIGFTKALAKEYGPSHITVNCVAPGVIGTEMNAALSPETLAALREETPLGEIGTPEDIAGVILFLASEKAAFLTGQVISPNGGIVI